MTHIVLVMRVCVCVCVCVYIYIYIYIYIYETCAWTPNNVFLSMVVVESLSSKLEWGLAQVFAISIPTTSNPEIQTSGRWS